MTAAIFALAGALIGVLGAFVVELVRARIENLRHHQETLRLTCADFTAVVSRMWNLAIELNAKPADTELTNSFHETFREARMHYERLRLTAASGKVQKEARLPTSSYLPSSGQGSPTASGRAVPCRP